VFASVGSRRVEVRSYASLIFDLFDTVVDFRRDRMPLVSVDGALVRSTSGHVYEAFKAYFPHIPFETFYAAFMEGYRDVERVRAHEFREVPSVDRFRLVLSKLQVRQDEVPADVPDRLAEIHMAKLSEAMVMPAEHVELLEWAQPRYRLAMISNFDHGPTARRVLERNGVIGHFEQIVISADEGLRKPHPEIFLRTLSRMGIEARQALFIGDSHALDVVGAKSIGMDVAWVNRGGVPLTDGMLEPDYTIRGIAELRHLL
jgi:FMN phosphatase YigB (HAD superfamily)